MTYLNGIVRSHKKNEYFDTWRCSMCAPPVIRHTAIRYPSSCDTRVNTGVFCLHGHSVSVNCLCHARMVLFVGGFFCVLCTKCTLHSNHRLIRVIFQHTKRLLPRSGHSHYIHSHRLAAEMWTTIKNEKMSCSFYLYRFRKYVSYGFLTINFCNPGVHYETPCIDIRGWFKWKP